MSVLSSLKDAICSINCEGVEGALRRNEGTSNGGKGICREVFHAQKRIDSYEEEAQGHEENREVQLLMQIQMAL